MSALTVFLIIAAAGFIFLLVSFLLSDLFEHFSAAHINVGTDGVALFDGRVLGIFLTAFGCVGAIAVRLGFGVVVGSLLGLLGGCLLGAFVVFFGRFLHRQQASSAISAHQLIGRMAEVTVTIQPGNVGSISCRIGGERVEKLARAYDDAEIKAGTTVLILEIGEDAVLVSADNVSNHLFPV